MGTTARNRFASCSSRIDVVDERGGLQRLAGPLPAQVVRRQAAQFVVDDWNERGKRLLIALTGLVEEGRNVIGLGPWALGHGPD